jgi:hypothetical protein
MKKSIVVLILVLVLALSLTIPAAAVTNGTPDGDGHPYVGLLVFDAPDAEGVVGPAWRCTGALIAPTVVLTAGHCTDGAVAARIWFKSDVTAASEPTYPYSGGTAIEGTPYTHPEFCIGCAGGLPGFDTHDVGIVVLDEPAPDIGFAALPAVGLVYSLKMNTEVTLVGYGVQYQLRGGGPPVWAGPRIRMTAPANLITSKDVLHDAFIKLSANPAQDKGGTCFGDSGGPDLLGGTNVVLGVNSFVNSNNCTGVTYSQRVDTPSEMGFITSFLP